MRYYENIQETTLHMIMPITEQIVRKFIKEIDVEKVFDNHIYINMDNSIASKSVDDNNNPILKDNKFVCDVLPNYDPKNTKYEVAKSNTFIGRNAYKSIVEAQYPIYLDYNANVVMTEQYMPCGLTLNCSMSFRNKVDAVDAMNKIYLRFSSGEMYMTNDLVFDYKVPSTIYSLLYVFYSMFEDRTPKEFVQHLRLCSNNALSVAINRRVAQSAKEKNELIVQKQAIGTIATIEFTQESPEAEATNKSPDLYKVNFTITTQFARPTTLIVDYPVIVNNKLLPEYALVLDKTKTYSFVNPAHSDIASDEFSSTLLAKLDNQSGPIRMPWYDDWTISDKSIFTRSGYKPFLIVALTLDDIDNPTGETVINLEAGFGEVETPSGTVAIKLKQEVIDTLKELKDAALWSHDRFNIAVYANYNVFDQDMLSLDDGVTLRIPARIKTKLYHLVISEKGVTDGNYNVARVLDFTIIARKK